MPTESDCFYTPRHVLSPPTPGGHEFWSIQDTKNQYAAVSIHKDFPFAEKIIRQIYRDLFRQRTGRGYSKANKQAREGVWGQGASRDTVQAVICTRDPNTCKMPYCESPKCVLGIK